jgi:hypothetical protein
MSSSSASLCTETFLFKDIGPALPWGQFHLCQARSGNRIKGTWYFNINNACKVSQTFFGVFPNIILQVTNIQDILITFVWSEICGNRVTMDPRCGLYNIYTSFWGPKEENTFVFNVTIMINDFLENRNWLSNPIYFHSIIKHIKCILCRNAILLQPTMFQFVITHWYCCFICTHFVGTLNYKKAAFHQNWHNSFHYIILATTVL